MRNFFAARAVTLRLPLFGQLQRRLPLFGALIKMRQRRHHFRRAVLCRQQRFKQRLRLTVHAGGGVVFSEFVINRETLCVAELFVAAQLAVQMQGTIQFATFTE